MMHAEELQGGRRRTGGIGSGGCGREEHGMIWVYRV
jgi:hypothetical protein